MYCWLNKLSDLIVVLMALQFVLGFSIVAPILQIPLGPIVRIRSYTYLMIAEINLVLGCFDERMHACLIIEV